MARARSLSAILLGAGAVLSGGCATGAAGAMPAVLESADAETMAALKTVLGEALNAARVELGAGDPSASPVIAVLPPKPGPHEDRSLARPILFDIEIRDGACVAVRRDTGQAFDMGGIACRAHGG